MLTQYDLSICIFFESIKYICDKKIDNNVIIFIIELLFKKRGIL